MDCGFTMLEEYAISGITENLEFLSDCYVSPIALF